MIARILSLTMTALLLAAGQAGAAEPKQVWEATGFQIPEAVVHDLVRDVLYVSNVNGDFTKKDGNGFISKLSPKGEAIEMEWVKGLDAPKGNVVVGDILYVSDLEQLVAIDIPSGRVKERYAAPGAFLNGVTADSHGRVYAADTSGNAIWRLEGGKFSKWLQDKALESPNGVLADDGRILVAAWGADPAPDFSTKVPGHVKTVDIRTKSVGSLTDGSPLGNLDGIKPDGRSGYTVTDFRGQLYRVSADGKVERLLALAKGSADHGFVEKDRLVVVPITLEGRIVAYRLD